MARVKALRQRVATLGLAMATIQPGGWRRSDENSNDRGYTYAWKKARDAWLKAHPLCVMCEAKDIIEPANVVDHRIPHRGDKTLFWDKTNWQSLCTPCHSGEKQREENGLGY